MTSVLNMGQRRTVASGRQNQDPNTPITPGREKATPKQQRPKVERSIQEVLNHKSNPSGRCRQMVLAALQKQKDAKESSPAVKTPQPVKNSGSVKRNGEGAHSAVFPVELKGNKISISDIRKRTLDQGDTRAPFAALTGSTTPTKQENDFTVDWPGVASPAQRRNCGI